jgi:hypothetical protein
VPLVAGQSLIEGKEALKNVDFLPTSYMWGHGLDEDKGAEGDVAGGILYLTVWRDPSV